MGIYFALLARVSLTNKLIVRFFLGHSSLEFVDQHVQAGQDMHARSQEELNRIAVGGNSGFEETKEAVMGDETDQFKRSLSSDDDSDGSDRSNHSDLSDAMQNNV
jgi:hypothetical protein